MTKKEEFVLNHYEITKDGRVFSSLNSNNNFQRKELKLRTDKDGYFDVCLVYNDKGDRMPFRVHRLVALKYIENPNNYPVINHKDLNKQNNNVKNLEWCSISYNTQHGYDNCVYSNIRQIKAIEQNGNELIFPSISHASRYYGYKNPSVINALLKKNKPISKGNRKGLLFIYAN